MRTVQSLLPFLASIGFFGLFSGLTVAVARMEAEHDHSFHQHLTEDVCLEAIARLQFFLDSHLSVASVFAQRWTTHGDHDFTEERFTGFGSVILEQLAGFREMGLVGADLKPGWAVPEGSTVSTLASREMFASLLGESRRTGVAVLSSPFSSTDGRTMLLMALPLQTKTEFFGYLLASLDAESLVAAFPDKVRADFDLRLEDDNKVVHDSLGIDASVRPSASEEFEVGGQTWRLTMSPRTTGQSGWTGAGAAVLKLGIVLSFILSWMAFVILRRTDLLRKARDRALLEVEVRRKVEVDLENALERHTMLARKVLIAQEEERARLSRDLHDELGQLLTALRMEMGWVEKQVERSCGEGVLLENTVDIVEKATEELRRICKGLRPPILDDLGIESAVHTLTKEFEERVGTTVDTRIRLDGEVSNEVALSAYRILQEALTNVRRHAGAEKLLVELLVGGDILELTVEDDGVGFDPDDSSAIQGFGLAGMRERAILVGGEIEVESVRGRGTRISFRAPLATTLEKGP